MTAVASDQEPLGVQAFSWLTLAIFNKLYDAFPAPIDLSGLRFVLETGFTHGPQSKEVEWSQYFDDSLRWLEAEGFLTVEGKTVEGKYIGVRLTLRGITALGYARSGLRKKPFIHKAKELLGSGFKASTGVAAKVLLGKLFEQALRSGS
jgi:hypothetical protein